MAVNLSPVGGAAAQFFDNSGNVLTGGKLYTYLAGTTTPAVTYTQANGITAHANPIVLNAAGRVPDSGEIWLTDSILYKFVLKDTNDVQIATWDNIDGINSNFVNYSTQNETATATQGQTAFTLTSIQYTPATNSLAVYVNGSKQILTLNYTETSSTVVTFVDGLNVGDVVQFTTAVAVSTNVVDASNVSYNEGCAGAVNRNVEAKLQESVSVKDFGAVGNGTTDDTAAINDAIACVGPTGTSLYFPAGKYLISSTIDVDYAITLFGDIATIYTQSSYPYGTVIVKSGSATGAAISLNSDKAAIKSMGVVGLAGNIGDGIHLNANGCLLENVQVKYAGNDGVRIGGYSTGINANSCVLNNVIVNYNGANGLYIHDGNGGVPNANACVLTSLSANFNTTNGINLGNCYQNTFIGAHLENNTGWGIKIDPEARNNYFVGGDNTETNGSGQLWNRGVSTMLFLDSAPTYTEAGTYTTAFTPEKALISGEIRQTPYPVSQQGGANYFSTQVLVDGFYGGASGTSPVTMGTTYRLFTCSMPLNGNFLQGTLYVSYHPAIGSTGTARTFKAYAISATTNSTSLAASDVTEIASYSDVDAGVVSNVTAISWAAGVLTIDNTNTRSDSAGQLLSWSFIGYQRGATNFTSVTAV